MGSQLIFRKKLNDLVNAAARPPKPSEAEMVLERLLSGAADEGLEMTLLLFQIYPLDDVVYYYDKKTARKLVSGLIAVLLEQTPDGLYVDSVGYNEVLLVMPGLSLTQGRNTGTEICRRFGGVVESVLPDQGRLVRLMGSVVNFPFDGEDLPTLLGLLRCAMFEAQNPDKRHALGQMLADHQDLSELLSPAQMEALKALSKSRGVEIDCLLEEAISHLLKQRI